MHFMPFDEDACVLRDVLRHITLAEQFTQELDYEGFRNDLLRLYAVIRCRYTLRRRPFSSMQFEDGELSRLGDAA
jgi:hypothetical protein